MRRQNASKRLVVTGFVALGLASAFAPHVTAGYIYYNSLSDFTFFPSPTKWDVGPGTASTFAAGPGPTGPMTPGGATWSVMGAGLDDGTIDTSHGNPSTSIAAILATIPGGMDAVLDTWAAVSGFSNLGMVTDGGGAGGAAGADGGVGDIRIGAFDFPALVMGSFTLAHAFQPGTEGLGIGNILGDIHFNDFANGPATATWVDDPTDTPGDHDFDTFTVALHEIGHALGLGHSSVATSVMFANYAGARRSLSPDDIAGIQQIYGAVPEPSSLAISVVAVAGFALSRLRRKRNCKNSNRWVCATRR